MFGEDEFNDLSSGRGREGQAQAPSRAPIRPNNIPSNAPYPALHAILKGTVKNIIPAGASEEWPARICRDARKPSDEPAALALP